jgi:hypothetical protein
MRQNLRQVLFCKIRHYVEQVPAPKMASARVKNLDQVRMGKLRRKLPSRDLRFGILRVGGNKLDGGLQCHWRCDLGEKHSTVVRPSHVLTQMKFPIYDLAFVLFPRLAHLLLPVHPKVEALFYASIHAANYSEVPLRLGQPEGQDQENPHYQSTSLARAISRIF